jgi:hypothetical protein
MVSYGRYLLIRDNNLTNNWTPLLPDVSKFTNKENLDLAYHAKSRFSSSNRTLISAMTFFERIDIISTSGQIVKSIIRENGNLPPDFRDVHEPFKPTNYTYYTDLCITDDYIFASCVGLRRDALLDKRKTNKKIESEIHVFTIDGIPVMNLICDIEVSKFTVDIEKRELYVLDFNSENYPILIYSFPNFVH